MTYQFALTRLGEPCVSGWLATAPRLGHLPSPAEYLARHSKSFHFAARLLPGRERERVARVYAWCRVTDDVVDRAPHGSTTVLGRLDSWLACSREAYAGHHCGIPIVDRVMSEMAERGIPFVYAANLVAGVRSDHCFERFADLDALGVYTRRVAGTVGRWLTELHGERDPWMLERADALGRAMQLTNILRDVGEDWDQGRLYLPLDHLDALALTPDDIGAMRRGERPIGRSYRALIEGLIDVAAGGYRSAREAIPYLPRPFRQAAAAAAAIYEGLHAEIRRNDYDNFTRRAVTSTTRKLLLAGAALSPRRRGSA
jgi:phytoene synthase